MTQEVETENQDEEELNEWSAQDWLFREYLEKLRKNNVERVYVVTEDKEGFQWVFNHNFLSNDYLKETLTELIQEIN